MGPRLVSNVDLPIDHNRLIPHAKNLAWELKPDSPLFENYTIETYWRGLTTHDKLRYVAAAEQVIRGLIMEIDKSNALKNATKAWLESCLD